MGIKKTVGANNLMLIRQFIGESVFFAFIAHLIAVILVELALPAFNNFSGRNLSLRYSDPVVLFSIVGLILFTGILSGSYPAFVLSSFNPVRVLKGIFRDDSRSRFRNALVVFQFTITIGILICTILVFRQMRFIQNKDLGLDKDHIITILLNRKVRGRTLQFKNEFMNLPGVLSASANGYEPSDMNWHQSVHWKGQQESERTGMWIIAIDKDFMKTLKIDMIEGQDFARNFKASDKFAYILNKSAREHIGWDSAVGKEFSIFGSEDMGTVVGVTEDFHFRSLHHAVEPCVMIVREQGTQISLRVNPANLNTTLGAVKRKWDELAQGFEFDYYFIDEDFDKLYRSETKLSQLIISFTCLSVFIACLGLLGLASFMAQQKTKEIGIRKVLGASVPGIVRLFNKEFLKLVLVSNIVAWPISFYVANKWLQNFAYRTSIGVGVFILSGILAVAVALLTVSFQSLKAATANPVESLRYE